MTHGRGSSLFWVNPQYVPASANHTGANGLGVRDMTHGRGSNFLGINPHYVPGNGPRIHERVVRYHGHAVVYVLIDVGDVIDGRAPVDDHRVVDIRDLRDIHRRIGDVHVVHVRAADVVSGNVDFAWGEWEPSHTNARREAETRTAAHERDQRRRPDGTHNDWPRHPEPSAVDEGPATVVEGSESPGLVNSGWFWVDRKS